MVKVESVPLLNCGPYPYSEPKRNQIRFTPTQIEAIKAGMQPGLTMVRLAHAVSALSCLSYNARKTGGRVEKNAGPRSKIHTGECGKQHAPHEGRKR